MLLNKYYAWECIKELPLSLLGELITTASDREQETRLLPLWLAYYAAKTLKNEPAMPFEEFLNSSSSETDGNAWAPAAKQPTAEEIIKEFAPIVAADELRRTKRGQKRIV